MCRLFPPHLAKYFLELLSGVLMRRCGLQDLPTHLRINTPDRSARKYLAKCGGKVIYTFIVVQTPLHMQL